RHKCNARSASHAPDTASDKRRILFVAADYGFYAGVAKPIENFVDLGSGNDKDVLDAASFQGFYNYVGSRLCLGGHLGSWIGDLLCCSHLLEPFRLIYSVFASSEAGSLLRSVVRNDSVWGR